MFEQAILLLLKGHFICETTQPQLFRWLKDEQHREDVSAYLAKIGRRLAMTAGNLAVYAAWTRIGSDERVEVRRVFASVKHTIRPVIQFLTLCMDASKMDSAPAVGDRIEYHALLRAVSENAHLLERLRSFTGMGKEFVSTDASPKGMLDRVLQQMERWGYLEPVNRDQVAYHFTGKLDYFHELIDFLQEHEGLGAADDSQDKAPEQDRLI